MFADDMSCSKTQHHAPAAKFKPAKLQLRVRNSANLAIGLPAAGKVSDPILQDTNFGSQFAKSKNGTS